mmetsp:Transcript_34734/g.87330  ORF Transcript_34734/g.87330 Transcript_34734/m.87330 type:complete len:299 (+) Transcript_34734:164-1060(+)
MSGHHLAQHGHAVATLHNLLLLEEALQQRAGHALIGRRPDHVHKAFEDVAVGDGGKANDGGGEGVAANVVRFKDARRLINSRSGRLLEAVGQRDDALHGLTLSSEAVVAVAVVLVARHHAQQADGHHGLLGSVNLGGNGADRVQVGGTKGGTQRSVHVAARNTLRVDGASPRTLRRIRRRDDGHLLLGDRFQRGVGHGLHRETVEAIADRGGEVTEVGEEADDGRLIRAQRAETLSDGGQSVNATVGGTQVHGTVAGTRLGRSNGVKDRLTDGQQRPDYHGGGISEPAELRRGQCAWS